MSLDRFSSPLSSERVNPYFMSLAIEEQRQEIKIDIIREFISAYFSATQELPDLDLIQETYYHLDFDDDTIKKELEEF
jgi:hypothetical protein